jgi:hypothetical protein
MAKFKQTVTYELAYRVREFLVNDLKISGLGDIDFKMNGTYNFTPSIAEEIDVTETGGVIKVPRRARAGS